MPLMSEVPAMTRSAERCVKDITASCKILYASHKETTVKDALLIGNELSALKDRCIVEGIEFAPELEKTEIPKSTAYNYMRIADNWPRLNAQTSSAGSRTINQLLLSLAGPEAEDEKEDYEEESSSSPAMTPNDPDWKFCGRDCRTGQKNSASCKKCLKLNDIKVTRSDSSKGGKKGKPAVTDNGKPREDAGADEEETPIQDAEGVEVPAIARAAFHAAKDIAAVCKEIGDIKKKIEDNKDKPGWESLLIDSITQALNNAKQTLYQSRATHVCPYCKGKGEKKGEKCNCCKGRGWTIKATYSQWAKDQGAK